MHGLIRSGLVAAALACTGAAAFGAASYRVVELPLAGIEANVDQSCANAINDHGVAAAGAAQAGFAA
jgi:hypothetical protein